MDEGIPRRHVYKSEYRNGAWTHPAGPGDNLDVTDIADNPVVAMNDDGEAIIVYRGAPAPGSGATMIFKSEYRNGIWTHPADYADHISLDDVHTYDPQVALDNNGNALITWTQMWNGMNRIYKSEYRNGVWRHPYDRYDYINDDMNDSISAKIAMNDLDMALIVYIQFAGICKSEYGF